MSKIDDGGAAFPRSLHPEHGYGAAESVASGMSIRDMFAGQALQGFIASYENGLGSDFPQVIAKWSYEMADAMIAERNKSR